MAACSFASSERRAVRERGSPASAPPPRSAFGPGRGPSARRRRSLAGARPISQLVEEAHSRHPGPHHVVRQPALARELIAGSTIASAAAKSSKSPIVAAEVAVRGRGLDPQPERSPRSSPSRMSSSPRVSPSSRRAMPRNWRQPDDVLDAELSGKCYPPFHPDEALRRPAAQDIVASGRRVCADEIGPRARLENRDRLERHVPPTRRLPVPPERPGEADLRDGRCTILKQRNRRVV